MIPAGEDGRAAVPAWAIPGSTGCHRADNKQTLRPKSGNNTIGNHTLKDPDQLRLVLLNDILMAIISAFAVLVALLTFVYTFTLRHPPGQDSDYQTRSAGVVQITTVEGRGLSSSKIRLYTLTSYILKEGYYNLTLRAIGGPASRQQSSLSCLLHLIGPDASNWG